MMMFSLIQFPACNFFSLLFFHNKCLEWLLGCVELLFWMSFWWCLALSPTLPRVCFLDGGSHAQLCKKLPNTPVISRQAVHDEILPNQLSSDVSDGTDWLEGQQTQPASHSDLWSSVVNTGRGKKTKHSQLSSKVSTERFALPAHGSTPGTAALPARAGTEPTVLL